MIQGFATSDGTARYRARFQKQFSSQFYRVSRDLHWSGIGAGTYLGAPTTVVDEAYASAVTQALESGINVLDTAINYRFQLSERMLGRVIQESVAAGKIKRDEIIVCTKGGFFSFDGAMPENGAQWIKQNFIDIGMIRQEDVIAGCHCMHPHYLEHQLNQSLANLRLETIDVYYIHNPEIQLEELEPQEFRNRLRHAFEVLERAVADGKIRAYGAATWAGFRQAPDASELLSLEEMVILAREVAGPNHHFKHVQLPFNIAMPEAWVLANQRYGAAELPLLKMANNLDITVAASGSLLQGKLTQGLPDFISEYFKECKTPAQVNLAFSQSVAGLTTALVGMKTAEHVTENIQAGKIQPSTEEQLIALFSKK